MTPEQKRDEEMKPAPLPSEVGMAMPTIPDAASGMPTQSQGKGKRRFGSRSPHVANLLINQMVRVTFNLVPHGEEGAHQVLDLVDGIGPRDETEGLLVIQMIASHSIAMEYARKAMAANDPTFAERWTNLSVKSMRTYTTQMEALNRYRGKGQQKVTVEHVTVNHGGQAIVGGVSHTGGAAGGG